eukprot:384657-Lingulodinium_polyedra.AAC.1
MAAAGCAFPLLAAPWEEEAPPRRLRTAAEALEEDRPAPLGDDTQVRWRASLAAGPRRAAARRAHRRGRTPPGEVAV